MILVDSSVWVDYFRNKDTPEVARLDRLLDDQTLAIGDLILIEVLQGFDRDRDFRIAREMLSSLEMVVLGGEDVAFEAARIFSDLARAGHHSAQDYRHGDCHALHHGGPPAVVQRPGFRAIC